MKDTKDNKLEKPKPIRKISNKKSVKPPKFNFMWIYGIILAAMFLFVYMMNDVPGKTVTFQQFTTMLKAGDVDKVAASKTGDFITAEIYLTKAALKKSQYADVAKDQGSLNMSGVTSQYQFTYPSLESLNQAILAAETGMPDTQKIGIEYKQNESLFSNPLVQIVLMVILVVGLWLFVMRRMSGGSGGGPGGQIFNIGKSKATLFDKEAQVSVTFNDVAGLEEAKQG